MNETQDAPYGYKANGEPFATAAAAASVAKRAATIAAKKQTVESPAPTTDNAGDLLSRHRAEWGERMNELAPFVDEYRRLEAAHEALAAVAG